MESAALRGDGFRAADQLEIWFSGAKILLV
jgi:hypothetical protein